MRILKLTEDTRKDILQNLLKRSPNNYGEFEGRVNAIIEEVRNNRDQAVFNYTKQFDGADINAGNRWSKIRTKYQRASVLVKKLIQIFGLFLIIALFHVLPNYHGITLK
jgi:histidinol dehydrogenase